MKNTIALALSGLFILGTLSVGCAASSAPDEEGTEDAKTENVGTSTEALSASAGRAGGGGGLGFNCTFGVCICNGDFDCNNLFASGNCDGKNNTCWTRGPAQYCTCYPKAASH